MRRYAKLMASTGPYDSSSTVDYSSGDQFTRRDSDSLKQQQGDQQSSSSAQPRAALMTFSVR